MRGGQRTLSFTYMAGSGDLPPLQESTSKNYFALGGFMKNRLVLTLILFLILSGLSSAQDIYTAGEACLKKGDWDNAVVHLKEALQQDPANPKILRDLGQAYYHLGKFDPSLECLHQAYLLDSLDFQTTLYLGLNYERKGDSERAQEVYQKYLQPGQKPRGTKKIRARLSWLNQQQIKKQIQAALANEIPSGDMALIPENSVTVLYFKDLSNNGKFDPLSKGIAEFITTDLSKTKKLQVVERMRLQTLLEELRLTEAGIVDSSTAPRIGRILGVGNMISGTIEEWGGQNLKMASGRLDVLTGSYDPVGEFSGRLDQFFRLEKKLVFGMIDHLGITLTKEERDEIAEVPTENLLAFLAYCEGLNYQDRGDYREAADKFKDAYSRDHNFIEAREEEQRSRDLLEGGVGIEKFEESCTSLIEKGNEDKNKGERLQGSVSNVTGDFIPDDPNAPAEDQSKGKPQVGSEGTVIIKGTIH
jgi:tetratricopeptide (TPR) repeat protein